MTTISPALTHRATVLRQKRRIDDATGKSYLHFPAVGTVRCFVDVTALQQRQPDTTPTTASQTRATVFAENGKVGVGDRLDITRPAGLGVFEIVDLRAVFDGYAAHHVEAEAVEVVGP